MATALHSMPSGMNEPALPAVAPLCELFIDRSEIARAAWAWARALAANLGGTARDHFAEAQRQAWASARETVREAVTSLDAARELHARQALEQAAEHGAALLLALGLPRLVGPGFVAIDPVQAGDALDNAIAALDALDAPEEDREPWLAGFQRGDLPLDAECDQDDELSLGWTSSTSQVYLGINSDDCEHSLGAPENHPWTQTSTSLYFYPANGSYRRYRNFHSQASWAAGAREHGEGESEAG